MSITANNKRHGSAAVALTLVALIPSPLIGAAEGPSAAVSKYVAEAQSVALREHHVQLNLDSRDIAGLATILEQIRNRHVQAPLTEKALVAEVFRWGAVLGEIQRSHWKKAYWGRSRDRNRKYHYSVYVPLESGDWLESNEFDLVEGFITKATTDLTIQQALWLHILD